MQPHKFGILVFISLFLASNSSFASTPETCTKVAKEAAHSILLLNHPEMARYAITTKAVEQNDADNSVTVYVNYWAPNVDENAVVTYTVATVPGNRQTCGIYSLTESSAN